MDDPSKAEEFIRILDERILIHVRGCIYLLGYTVPLRRYRAIGWYHRNFLYLYPNTGKNKSRL